MDTSYKKKPPEVIRSLLVHKADNGARAIFNDPGDLVIGITALASEPAYQAEGTALAEALWGTLPAITINALIKRLGELSKAQ